MKCTKCKQGFLTPIKLEPTFPCLECSECQGHWLYLEDYLRWLEQSSTEETLESQVNEHIEVDDSKQALLCPETGRIMLKYRISADNSHKVDLSPEVNGIWLDKGEWTLLKNEGLARKLNQIFTEPWQRKIREETAQRNFADQYQNTFGEADYEELKHMREWLNSKKNKQSMIAYLLAENPYSALH
ncbi:zf-TFIIB domain-containing protein [Endozoicomonas sp. SM1973]|uniref:Zf-TFIIB domain-containing protein n=1 Tax=Spartinivicinus marinus TaxID=2994442 RepID=A0A853I557_9GAMM|nr:zf-TFIIB domain-containing protein [Spartinivicinus marinus]MCX4026054.1 zf-TFIIB domain-containing protein [Spartinivicinus marinus]NYZ69030.1 zf-TFIIB domain-containing protein [Spartinivicinus marinus]